MNNAKQQINLEPKSLLLEKYLGVIVKNSATTVREKKPDISNKMKNTGKFVPDEYFYFAYRI